MEWTDVFPYRTKSDFHTADYATKLSNLIRKCYFPSGNFMAEKVFFQQICFFTKILSISLAYNLVTRTVGVSILYVDTVEDWEENFNKNLS